MQNPALGALLLWRFAKAYASAHPEREAPPLTLAFLVLPILWHAGSAAEVKGTQTGSGLRKFAAKFTERNGAREVLLTIHDRALRWRPKTKEALRMALATGLAEVNVDGRLVSKRDRHEEGANRVTAEMADGADKLGVWFAALTLPEVGMILHVQF